MRILVTSVSGFIGGELVLGLESQAGAPRQEPSSANLEQVPLLAEVILSYGLN